MVALPLSRWISLGSAQAPPRPGTASVCTSPPRCVTAHRTSVLLGRLACCTPAMSNPICCIAKGPILGWVPAFELH